MRVLSSQMAITPLHEDDKGFASSDCRLLEGRSNLHANAHEIGYYVSGKEAWATGSRLPSGQGLCFKLP